MALRVGTESKPKLYAAIGLGALVLILAIVQLPKFFSGSSSPAPAPASAPAATQTTVAASQPAQDASRLQASPYPHDAVQLSGLSALDPALHPELMEQAENTTYRGNGRNIFSPDSVAPTPVNIEKPKAFRPSPVVVPQGPPPPPPIDLKYYGYASAGGGRRQIFLLHGDDIFVAHEGDIVDRRYRVVTIRPFSVEIEDIPYHNTQSLPLSQN